MAGRGFNTAHGFDNGPPPPYAVPPFGMPGNPGFYPQMQGFGWPQQPPPIYQPAQPPFIPSPYGGFGMGGQTWPTVAPFTDQGFPGIHLRNHTGGVGLPPGYDYAFPQEHCKIHVFKTKQKPWQVTVYKEDTATHVRLFVPVNTSIKDLMQNLGCTNTDAAKNVLYECTEKGNGQWATGLKIKGDDKDRVKKLIGEYGWDKSRTGHPGEKPVVWLWVTKDGDKM
ncbi:hypothetical protein EG329_008891 [Mollisiaceae sp. DMI_Dod_QoI]|nr:hypothetical protein EG329_008891 [Helotiales sp. DMI_Dod_QoI]